MTQTLREVIGLDWRGNLSEGGACFSKDMVYRYSLWRVLPNDSLKTITFVMLNPSTADENVLDPTVTRCRNYAMEWGYGVLHVVNIFALRSTDPALLRAVTFSPIGEHNDEFIRSIADSSDMVVCAWGTHGAYLDRGRAVRDMLWDRCIDTHVLALTKDGHPAHPLYLKGDLQPTRWSPAAGI